MSCARSFVGFAFTAVVVALWVSSGDARSSPTTALRSGVSLLGGSLVSACPNCNNTCACPCKSKECKDECVGSPACKTCCLFFTGYGQAVCSGECGNYY